MILIFDYDGTCHDTIKIYGHAVREAEAWLKGLGYTARRSSDDESLSRYLGMTADDMWNDFMPSAPPDIRKQASLLVQDKLINAIYGRHGRLYDGIDTMLDSLKQKGHTLLLLSNCTQKYRLAHWKVFGLSEFVDKFYDSESFNNIPKEEIFELIKQEYPGEYVMIGDRLSDLKVGFVHGFTTVACLYGYGSEEELKDADYKASSVEELANILDQIC